MLFEPIVLCVPKVLDVVETLAPADDCAEGEKQNVGAGVLLILDPTSAGITGQGDF